MTTHTQYVPPFPWDLDAFPFVLAEDAHLVPALPGLYFLRAPHALLYLGQSVNMQRRFLSHTRLRQLIALATPLSIAWLPRSRAQVPLLRRLETQAIAHYQPCLNWECHVPDESTLGIPPPRATSLRMLQTLRKERGLTQKQVADAIGCCHTSMVYYEQGRVNPSLAKMQKLAAVLGTTLEQLFTDDRPAMEDAADA